MEGHEGPNEVGDVVLGVVARVDGLARGSVPGLTRNVVSTYVMPSQPFGRTVSTFSDGPIGPHYPHSRHCGAQALMAVHRRGTS